jgi:hypothetical protein
MRRSLGRKILKPGKKTPTKKPKKTAILPRSGMGLLWIFLLSGWSRILRDKATLLTMGVRIMVITKAKTEARGLRSIVISSVWFT